MTPPTKRAFLTYVDQDFDFMRDLTKHATEPSVMEKGDPDYEDGVDILVELLDRWDAAAKEMCEVQLAFYPYLEAQGTE